VRYIGLSNYHAWQAALALGIQKEEHLERFITAQLYYSLVGRDLEHEWMGLAEYANLGIMVWSPLAGGFLAGKYEIGEEAPPDTRFAEAGQFVPFGRERGERVLEALRKVAGRHNVSDARVSLAWLLTRPNISCVIIAGRKLKHLDDDIQALDLELTDEDLQELNDASDPGYLYPRWMVLQQNLTGDYRKKILKPELFEDGGPWEDLRKRNEW